MAARAINCADCGRVVSKKFFTWKLCEECGEKRAAKYGGTNYTTEALVPTQCTDCGAWYTAKRSGGKYCPQCRTSNHRRVRRERERLRRAGQLPPESEAREGCTWCGATVKRGVHYCSELCAESMKADEARAAEVLRMLEHEQRRRIDDTRQITYRASSLAEAEATQHIYGGPGRAEARENALTGLAPASMFRGIRKGV